MALRSIITLPDKRLRIRAAPVARVDDEVRALMDDLLETMYAAPGIGLGGNPGRRAEAGHGARHRQTTRRDGNP